ncbi:MAG TPA: hypothetical protein VGI60_09135 [Chthoniobacterales bacterium]|jgi:hypothetical protein
MRSRYFRNLPFFSGVGRSALVVALLVWIALMGLNGCATDYEDFNPDPAPPENPEFIPRETVGNLPTGAPSPTPRNPFNQPVNPYSQ